MRNPDSSRRLFAALLFLALAMRLIAVWLAWGGSPFGDAMRYLQLAQSIRDGSGLHYASHNPAGSMWAVYPPAYPALLAAWSLSAPLNAASLALFNSLFDLLAAWLLAHLAREAGLDRASPWIGLAYLLWPAAAFAVPLAEKESLEAMLAVAMALAAVQLAHKASPRGIAVAGLVAAGLILTQPSLALLPPLLFLVVRGRSPSRRAWWQVALASGAVAVLLMVPWWARNFAVFHQLVPLTTSGGRSLWVGSLPDGGSAWHAYPPGWKVLNEVAFDAQARAAALANITADPRGWFVRCLLKFPESFLRPHYALGVLALLQPSPVPGLIDQRLLLLLPTAVELVVTLFAIWAAVRRPGTLASRLVLAVLGYLLVVTIWFEFSERHRAYLAPFALLAAAQLLSATKPRNESAPGAL